MKESLKEILHTDIIGKTKSTLHDIVAGVKNLFRPPADSPLSAENNYLKSPDEIEAEMKLFAASQPGEDDDAVKNNAPAAITVSSAEMQISCENLPAFMEENY